MTDRERDLILRRLCDKGLLPYEGADLDAAALEKLSEREMEVLREEVVQEIATIRAQLDALLKVSPAGVSKFAKLTLWLKLRWLSLRAK